MNKYASLVRNFMHGRFKNRVLKEPYRELLVKVMYSLVGIIILGLIYSFIQVMTYFSNFINYVFN